MTRRVGERPAAAVIGASTSRMRGIPSTTQPLVEEQMHHHASPLFALAMSTAALASACSRSSAPAAAPAPAPAPVSVAPPQPSESSSLSGAHLPDTARAEREYRGSYSRGWEASWFAPCDAPRYDALWWVTLTEPARLQRDSLLSALSQAPTGALAVRWRGTISNRMPAGQMGRGTRYMLITEVLEVRPLAGSGMCSLPGRSS